MPGKPLDLQYPHGVLCVAKATLCVEVSKIAGEDEDGVRLRRPGISLSRRAMLLYEGTSSLKVTLSMILMYG